MSENEMKFSGEMSSSCRLSSSMSTWLCWWWQSFKTFNKSLLKISQRDMSESCMMVERESGIQVLNWVIFNPVSLRSLFHPPLSHPAAAQLRVKKLCNSVVISLSPFVQRLLDSLGFYNAWYTRKMDETETFSFHSRRFFIFIYSRHSASSSSLPQWKMHLKFSRSSPFVFVSTLALFSPHRHKIPQNWFLYLSLNFCCCRCCFSFLVWHADSPWRNQTVFKMC